MCLLRWRKQPAELERRCMYNVAVGPRSVHTFRVILAAFEFENFVVTDSFFGFDSSVCTWHDPPTAHSELKSRASAGERDVSRNF